MVIEKQMENTESNLVSCRYEEVRAGSCTVAYLYFDLYFNTDCAAHMLVEIESFDEVV